MSELRYDRPLDLLNKMVERGIEVLIKLKDGTEYTGVIESADLSMNLIVNNAIQIGEDGAPIINYGRIFIRGSNIVFVAVKEDKVIL